MVARRGRLSVVAILSLAGILVVTLVGCAPAAHEHSATASTPTPISTPTPTQAATPPALLDGDCSSLVPLSTVVAAMPGVTPIAQTAPRFIYEIPLPQAGGIQCQWYNAKQTAGFAVSLMPNAASAFAAHAAAMKKYDDAAGPAKVKNVPTYGDQSFTQCLSVGDDPAYGCSIDILQGSVWIDVRQNTNTITNPYPEPAGLRAFLTALVAKAKILPPVTPWVPQTDGFTVPTTCAAALPPATLLQDTGLSLELNPDALVDGPFSDAALLATGSLQCQWVSSVPTSTRTTVQVIVVPGSSWAWAGMLRRRRHRSTARSRSLEACWPEQQYPDRTSSGRHYRR
jgi:hypothetical protein